MDPLTQGLFGALAAQTVAKKELLGKASFIGAIAGMVPDLDVLIRSNTDPLLYLEYHRHFTHSLFFAPVGGAICGVLLFLVFGKLWKLKINNFIVWSIVGYATHGLLDACTSYGTQLLWPFSNSRVAWDIMSIIDPIFSGVLLILIGVSAMKNKKTFSYVSISWIVLYFTFSSIQHYRAVNWGKDYASSLGQTPVRLSAKPSFGNILVWKVIYEANDIYYVFAVKPYLGGMDYWHGDSIAKLNIGRDFPWLPADSQQARDIERFRHFSNDYLAIDSENPARIGDMRYSSLPHQIQPLWGIELDAEADTEQHVKYYTDRSTDRSVSELMEMLNR